MTMAGSKSDHWHVRTRIKGSDAEPTAAGSALRRQGLVACGFYAVAVFVAVATIWPNLRDSSIATAYVWIRGGVLLGLWLIALNLGIRLVVRVAPSAASRVAIVLATVLLLGVLAALDIITSALLDFFLFF